MGTRIELPNLNVENAIKLRDFLRALPAEVFDHWQWYSSTYSLLAPRYAVDVGGQHVCGTAACIGGWAVILFAKDKYELNSDNEAVFCTSVSFAEETAKLLGMTTTDMPDGVGEKSYLAESAQGSLMWPFNWDEYEFETRFDLDCEDARVLADQMYSDTTNAEAAEFLDLMIKEKAIDIRWWHDIRVSNM